MIIISVILLIVLWILHGIPSGKQCDDCGSYATMEGELKDNIIYSSPTHQYCFRCGKSKRKLSDD